MRTTPKSIFKFLFLMVVIAAGIYVAGKIFWDYHFGRKEMDIPPVGGQRSAVSGSLSPTLYWQAKHETGNMEEYTWWKEGGVSSGTLTVVPDPTGTGHGYVLRSEITRSFLMPGESHRIYPVIMLPECYRGSYTSTFSVWADLPPHSPERGWISFATYTNQAGWKDLFGVNLGNENGQDCLVLFHVPEFGKGRFTRFASVPFPMKKWVTISVKVDDTGIMLFQDDRLVAEAKRNWGPAGVGLCEAHWGLYGQGKTQGGVLLNDDLSISFDRTFNHPVRFIRPENHKPSTAAAP